MIHALVDLPLQGHYIAKQKARRHADKQSVWIVALAAHCMIHGGVWLVSASLALDFAELFLHASIDPVKGEEKFNLVTDPLLPLSCKLAYALLLGCGFVAP